MLSTVVLDTVNDRGALPRTHYQYKKIPQLVPFFFTGQIVFVFIAVIYLVYLFSKYVLPHFLRNYVVRDTI